MAYQVEETTHQLFGFHICIAGIASPDNWFRLRSTTLMGVICPLIGLWVMFHLDHDVGTLPVSMLF
jgi:hypothetical protein